MLEFLLEKIILVLLGNVIMKNTKFIFILFFCLFSFSCSNPSALSVCKKLESENIVNQCSPAEPKVFTFLAKEEYEANIQNLSENKCFIMLFDNPKKFQKTVKAYEAMSSFIGPHRYHNENKMIFVQCNKKMAIQDGQQVKNIVSSL